MNNNLENVARKLQAVIQKRFPGVFVCPDKSLSACQGEIVLDVFGIPDENMSDFIKFHLKELELEDDCHLITHTLSATLKHYSSIWREKTEAARNSIVTKGCTSVAAKSSIATEWLSEGTPVAARTSAVIGWNFGLTPFSTYSWTALFFSESKAVHLDNSAFTVLINRVNYTGVPSVKKVHVTNGTKNNFFATDTTLIPAA